MRLRAGQARRTDWTRQNHRRNSRSFGGRSLVFESAAVETRSLGQKEGFLAVFAALLRGQSGGGPPTMSGPQCPPPVPCRVGHLGRRWRLGTGWGSAHEPGPQRRRHAGAVKRAACWRDARSYTLPSTTCDELSGHAHAAPSGERAALSPAPARRDAHARMVSEPVHGGPHGCGGHAGHAARVRQHL